ncbi:protein O-mannosyl-transferase 2-like [Homalodisca vitripennis]|uniref:protein O-mannosyl-transferase 2-like n=1 Tax=Homalodisca vitripennis TaxID=197043 RepID=UPI001EEC6097|nr:protein O-mannosyl-transferase 2-like [Homalodisca vitripennis]
MDIACPVTKTRVKPSRQNNLELLNPDIDLLRKQFLKAQDRYLSTNSQEGQNLFLSSGGYGSYFTGVMIACAFSVKFVGLFCGVAGWALYTCRALGYFGRHLSGLFLWDYLWCLLVGLCTLAELWDILGDISRPVTYTIKHFIARVFCLIILPVCLYVSFFYIHLTVLNKSGNGDGFYSSAFQSQLQGNTLHNASMPRDVAYGAVVTLKIHRTGGGYLHSHWHLYPEGVGARQQQVTTYTHKDDNNRWVVKKYNKEVDKEDEVELVRHGDLIRLEHVVTRRNLHSHREPAPVTKKHYQVTGYGENGTGDANDVWMVQVVGGVEGDIVSTVTSKLRLVHFLQHCILTSSGKQLPKWAYEQQEVSCNPNLRDKNAIWNVEDNIFAKLPNVSFEVYAPGFLERLIESHAVMLQGNAGLKPKEGEVTSRPWQWPINYRGQFFSGSSHRIYLLGNPVIWWSNLVFLVLFLFVFLCNVIKHQRGYPSPPHIAAIEDKMVSSCGWLFLGWCLHYVPFWAMGRVLYFHHYFPALLYSSMLSGVLIGYVLEVLPLLLPERVAISVYHWLIGVIISAVGYSFYLFAPLAYGMSGPSASDPNSTMYGLRWMESWEF